MRRRHLFGLLLGSLGVGCAPGDEAPALGIGLSQEAIKDGVADTTSKNVVAVTAGTGSLCTGSLIAPNVVLTARHCVSATLPDSQNVICSETESDTPYSPNAFFVTTADEVTPGTLLEFFVEEVVVPTEPGPSPFCGNDIAILILAGNVPETTATPMVPRLDDDPLSVAEVYTAVGYGAVDGAGNDAGTRRRREGLSVSCVTDGCVEQSVFMGQVTATEWAGNGGVCQGDSGGPAIDDEGRVVGVTSRGSKDCDASIYAYTGAWTTWLKDTVVYASGAGLYQAPSWTEGSTVDPEHSMPVGASCAADGDCPSGKCLTDGDVSYCTRACADEHPCPEDYLCRTDTPFGSACVATPASKPTPPPSYERPPKDGCAMRSLGSPSSGDATTWLVMLALGLAMARRRREAR